MRISTKEWNSSFQTWTLFTFINAADWIRSICLRILRTIFSFMNIISTCMYRLKHFFWVIERTKRKWCGFRVRIGKRTMKFWYKDNKERKDFNPTDNVFSINTNAMNTFSTFLKIHFYDKNGMIDCSHKRIKKVLC